MNYEEMPFAQVKKLYTERTGKSPVGVKRSQMVKELNEAQEADPKGRPGRRGEPIEVNGKQFDNKSDAIRWLFEQGERVKDIAKIVGVRYQQAYNVVKQYEEAQQ